jgi:hypothetical protein
MILKKQLIPLLICAAAVIPAFAEDEPTPIISGTVSTTAKKPLSGIQVLLLDQGGGQLANAVTNARGHFSFKHIVCRRCTLQIIPDQDTHYACALIENIPGDINRNFLLSMQRGFTISGRVIGNGRGLKGLAIKATSLDTNAEGTKVHDGGIARTGRNGVYSMILTPGHKKIEVQNDKFSEFAHAAEMNVDVTADAQIADIALGKERP